VEHLTSSSTLMPNARSLLAIAVDLALRFIGYQTAADFGSGAVFVVGLILFGWLLKVPRRVPRE
jgi:hypothetical protein